MTKESALTLADAVVAEASRTSPSTSSAAMRAAAMIRAIADEVDRHHPSDSRIVALHSQLGDELTRLADVVTAATGPDSRRDDGDVDIAPLDVLVVDDEANAVQATAIALKSLGYRCRTAPSGEAALREYEREPAAIVVSDWSMPGMSGLDLCVALKSMTPQPYVILATAHTENARLLDLMRGGVDDVMRKPIDLDELALRLDAASRLVRAVRTVSRLTQRMRAATAPEA